MAAEVAQAKEKEEEERKGTVSLHFLSAMVHGWPLITSVQGEAPSSCLIPASLLVAVSATKSIFDTSCPKTTLKTGVFRISDGRK